VGVGICATGVEYLDEPAIVLMAGDFPRDSFSVFSGKAPPPAGARKAFFGIVHADPQTPDVAELIADMSGKVSSGYLCGGLSSSRSSTVQIANQVFSGGLSGVVFDEWVSIATRLTQGVSPVNQTRHTITQGERNYIVEINDRPALDVLLEDYGIKPEGLQKHAREIYVGLPVVGSEGALGSGDYVVRNLIGIDPHNKIVAISDHVQVGQPIVFCRRDQESARGDLIRMIYDLKDDLTEPPKAALYHACIGRGPYMFGEQHAELKLIREHLGDIPLVGFFANGEIARDQLYGYTGVLTVFK
jgi:small ligand-binding sensory domain FIST